jgi:thiol-disulfide isomerase/thioredoxin
MSSSLTVKTIPILRMDCPMRGNYLARTLKVTFDSSKAQLAEIEAAIERVGYRIAYKKYPGPLTRLRDLFKRDTTAELEALSDGDFPGKVLHASKTVAVLFSSPTCPTCSVFKPKFLDLVEKMGEAADFYEMNIAATETWRKYNVLSIPQVIVFRAGDVSERFTGMPVASEIEKALGA